MSFRVLLFNSWVWIQTVVLFAYTNTESYLRSFFVRSEDPTNPGWIQTILRTKFSRLPPIVEIRKSSKSLNGGGLVGLLYSIELRYGKRDSSAGYPHSLVVKQGKEHFQARLKARYSGSAREALFYQQLVPKHGILSSCVPEIYYSRGDLRSGECIIVMEDLQDQAVPSGHLLGNQCWGEVPIPIELEMVSREEVLRTVFMKMAEIHVHFWRDKQLLGHDWLKGVPWRKGGGKLTWEVAMLNMRSRWIRVRDHSTFTPLLTETIDCLLERTSWSRWQKLNDIESPDTPFTLVHGDFHANNILFLIEKREPRTIFVDWSEVGIGCPFTEMAQFMISNATIEFRRAHERSLFNSYYSYLIDSGVDASRFPRAKCWERYQSGGIERWLQFLILLDCANLPEFSLVWFSRQVESFLQDHSSSVPECFNSVYVMPL
ncbi:hypothetical protein R1flu_022377 [Riccia fluitans]|uniref:Aminoglycoside phosphotransferase domain-containing protein n=1 Tax=Riccia fluitans TaxID=41844 RepID=A0ABD1ZUX2_9MARC